MNVNSSSSACSSEHLDKITLPITDHAAGEGEKPVVRIPIRNVDGKLVSAVINGESLEKVRSLIKLGSMDLEETDFTYSRTPLVWAVLQRDTRMVQLLLECGASTAARDLQGLSVLAYATLETYALLVDYGATR